MSFHIITYLFFVDYSYMHAFITIKAFISNFFMGLLQIYLLVKSWIVKYLSNYQYKKEDHCKITYLFTLVDGRLHAFIAGEAFLSIFLMSMRIVHLADCHCSLIC